ncbi:hypothetical protein WJX73_009361 [Symbiochloris irregularis]|uniref:Uncharacterized protein n=1 Tax=Symbiochloris irregularis TaxID=706552 RepID=A0AAW1Q0H6_9CHLO
MEEQSYAERGATAALERVCSLESRLRQALQNSGPLRTMFGPRRGSEERELRALQSVQEQLELLEEKLRDFRALTIDPREYDDKTIILTQIDSLRKELLAVAINALPHLSISKDVVKDIVTFADLDSEGSTTPRPSNQPPEEAMWSYLSPEKSAISGAESEVISPLRSAINIPQEESSPSSQLDLAAGLHLPISSVSPRQSMSQASSLQNGPFGSSIESFIPPMPRVKAPLYPGQHGFGEAGQNVPGWDDDPFPHVKASLSMTTPAQKPEPEDPEAYGGHVDLSTFQSNVGDAENCFGILPEKSRVCEVVGPDRLPPPRPPSDTVSSVRSSFTFTPVKQPPVTHATPLKAPKSTRKRAQEQAQPQSEESTAGVDRRATAARGKGWFLLKAALVGITLAAGVTKGVASHNAAAGRACSPGDKDQRPRRQEAKDAGLHRTPGYPSSAPAQQTYMGAPHADLPHGPMFPSLPAPDPMRGRG